jgi:hypothetical protein
MFTPFEPRAGPTGGEGLAAPPLICNLINPATFFGIIYLFLIDIGDLHVFRMITQEALGF